MAKVTAINIITLGTPKSVAKNELFYSKPAYVATLFLIMLKLTKIVKLFPGPLYFLYS
jgi:hypothetical protein